MAAWRYNISLLVLKKYFTSEGSTLLFFCYERRDWLCSHSNGDLFTCENNMLFPRMKISCFRGKAHLVFHWCLYSRIRFWYGFVFSADIEDITWPRGDTKFLSECWKIFHEWAQRTSEIISKWGGHVMFNLLYKHQWNTKPFHCNSFFLRKARFIM